jgi:hypothetical protein
MITKMVARLGMFRDPRRRTRKRDRRLRKRKVKGGGMGGGLRLKGLLHDGDVRVVFSFVLRVIKSAFLSPVTLEATETLARGRDQRRQGAVATCGRCARS